MRLGIVAGIALAVALAGCGSAGTIEVVPPASAPSAPASLDCGTFVLDQGERIAADASECFLDATTAGDPARLEVTFLTVEGDPVTQTYRHLGAGRVQVVTDSTQDRSGSGRVETQTCTEPVRSSFALTFGQCD